MSPSARQCKRTIVAALLLLPVMVLAQGPPRGFWSVPGGAAAHDGWQKAETDISAESVTTTFKFLWKLKLGSRPSSSFNEPLLVPGMITGRGFKDFAFWADSKTLYAVDSELGNLVWQKDIETKSPGTCGGVSLQLATEAPQVIHFGAKKPAGARPAPQPASEERVPAAERRVGGAAGGGYFGLKGIYVLTSDGYLHEQIMATGLDYAPPVRLFPEAGGQSFGLNMNDRIVYAASAANCHSAANGLWGLDLNTPEYPVSRYQSPKLTLAGMSGAAISEDGTAYVATGAGAADAAAGFYPHSVIALNGSGLKAKDWYTPGPGKSFSASPVVFSYKDKQLVAALGQNGSVVLLDTASLGGSDHHTPLAESGAILKGGKLGEWNGLASWPDKAGAVWVLASIAGPLDAQARFAQANGSAPHGSVAAFKVEEKDGHTVLTPAWVSRDLVNPAPPVIANGVVFALEAGTPSTHATLYALDAATGKQLFSSGDTVSTYAHWSGLAAGDGHVFFTTHDNTLYSFGIPLEH